MTSSGTASPAPDLAFFLYRSVADLDGDESAEREMLRDILAVARRRNAGLGLTGCLHHEDGMFFQWLEGPAGALAEVVASIRRDPRHSSVTVLDEGACGARRYQDWQMRFSDVRRGSLLDWLADSGAPTVRGREYAMAIAAFLLAMSAV